MRFGAPLVLAAIAAVLVLALWFTLRSASEINSTARLSDALAETEVELAPALIAPSGDVRRDESEPIEAADAIDTESASTRLDPGDLVVRFLDAGGAPVQDLQVALKVERAKPNEHGNSHWHYSVWAARGDVPRHGIRIPAKTLEDAFAITRQARAEGHEVSMILSPACTTPKCTSYTFAELEKPAEDIDLRTEGSGFVRIEALEPNGEPYVHDLSGLVTIAPSAINAGRPDLSSAPQHWQPIPAANPRVRVSLGQVLILKLKDQGNLFHYHQETIAGPTSEGSEVLLRFTFRPYSFVVGRLLSLEGEPMRKQIYSCTLEASGFRTDMSGNSTDAEGRFRVTLAHDPPPQKLKKLILRPLWNESELLNKGTLEKLAQAALENLDIPAAGERDLGDVRLAAPDLKFLASGVVVDGEGKPIADAQLSAWHVWPPVDQSPWDDWDFLDDASTTTNARGEFEIFSKKPCRALRVGAAKPGHYLEKGFTLELGRTDVRLVLRPGITITGSVLLPEGFPHRAISIVRYPEKGNPEHQSINADGGFRFEGCKPGVHEFRVEMRPWTLIEIPGVIVGAEQEPPDPRLRLIDLRSRVTVLRIRVLDANGNQLRHQTISYSQADDAKFASYTHTESIGIAAIAMPVEVTTLAISIDGGVPRLVRWSPEVQEVRLLAPITIELTREPPTEVPERINLYVSLTLGSEPPAGVDPKLLIPRFCSLTSEKGICHLPVAGTYRVIWRASTNARHFEFEAATPQEIKVLAGDGVQRLSIALPLDAFRAAIQELGR